jgi:hypothetical protein
LALAAGFAEAIERIGIGGKAPLEVLPAASCLASQPFFNKDISFERYYTKMPPSNPHNQSESFSFSPHCRSRGRETAAPPDLLPAAEIARAAPD